jgi:hypothetical protein
MELLLKYAEPALADASYCLIDLVDRVLKRHPGKAKPRRKLFSFLKRDRPPIRPSLDRPSQKIAEPLAPFIASTREFVVPACRVELGQDVSTAGVRFGEKSHFV